MTKITPVQQFFNTGVVDKDKLHRTDLLRVALGAEEQTNILGTVTGSMFMRPGFEYIGTTSGPSDVSRLLAYYRSESERAMIELGPSKMRVWVDDELVDAALPGFTVSNSDFNTSGSWTLENGATIAGGRLRLARAARGVKARAYQEVTNTGPALSNRRLSILVASGTVTFRANNILGGESTVATTKLRAGIHSLALPSGTGTFYVEFINEGDIPAFIEYCRPTESGVVELATQWGPSQIGLVRADTSLDVMYCACAGRIQRRIERRPRDSWSLTYYVPEDGPFSGQKMVDARIRRVESDVSTVDWEFEFDASVASKYTDVYDVGGLIRIHSDTKEASAVLGDENTFTDPIRVSGIKFKNAGGDVVYNDRSFDYVVSGTWEGTLKNFRSFDGPDFGYREFRRAADSEFVGIIENGSYTNDDEDNNAIIWYRIGFDDGDYDSGRPTVTLTYNGDYTSTIYFIEAAGGGQVYGNLNRADKNGGIASVDGWTDEWENSDWPSISGWPLCVSFHDGRLFWGGGDRLWGSVSDAYDSFDDEFEGDAGPINRALAAGGSNTAYWMMSLEELIVGTSSSVLSVKASTQGEILTPSDTTIKQIAGSVSCAPIDPVQVGAEGFFVDGTFRGLRVLRWTGSGYAAMEISKLTTEVFASGIVSMSYQSAPDPRIWVVTGDGKLICLVYDPENEVLGFFPCETDGHIEDVEVLRGAVQDRVYIVVRREIDGNTVRYIEKMALDSEARPNDLCKVMDSFVVRTASGLVVSGLDHLEGASVIVWSQGMPILEDGEAREFTVASGQITLPSGYTGAECVVGLPYSGRYKSGRLGYGVEGYNPMLKNKRLAALGLLMTDYVRSGIRIGSDFDRMDPMRTTLNGTPAPEKVLGDVPNEEPMSVEGAYDLDARTCIEVKPGHPARFLALSMEIAIS